MRDLVEHFRRVAIDLRDHRTLDLRIQEVPHQRVWRVERGLDVDKFGKRHIRTAVLGCDEAKGSVGDTVHGREPDDGFIYLLPEIHVGRRLSYYDPILLHIGRREEETPVRD